MIEQFDFGRYASFTDALTMRWRNKKLGQFFFPLLLLAANFGYSDNRCDRTVRFAALCIVFRCAYDEMEK